MRSDSFQLYRRGSIWWCRFSVNGEQIRRSTGKSERTEASVEAHSIWLRHTGRPDEADVDPLHDDPLDVFDHHIAKLRKLGRSEDTLSNYLLYASRYTDKLGNRRLSSLRPKDIEAWRDWLLEQTAATRNPGQHFSPKYVKEHICWLAGVFNYFNLANPCLNVELPSISQSEEQERLKFFTTEQMRALKEKITGTDFENAFTFFAFTGCRDGEMRGLRHSPTDMNHKRQMVWITGKGSIRRQLTLTGAAEPAWLALRAEIDRRGVEPGGYIFHHFERWADKRLRAACLRCDFHPVGPHTLRHTFASHALMEWGWDLGLLAKWLGHKNINTTYKIYGHLLPKEPPRIEY